MLSFPCVTGWKKPTTTILPLTEPPPAYFSSSSSSSSTTVPQGRDGMLSTTAFLDQVAQTRALINELSTVIADLARSHQRNLSSPTIKMSIETASTFETIIHSRIEQICDRIKGLAIDATNSHQVVIKQSQIRILLQSLKRKVDGFRDVQKEYGGRYREEMMTVASRHGEVTRMEKSCREVQEIFDDLVEVVAEQESVVIKSEFVTIDLGDEVGKTDIASAKKARWCKRISCGLLVLFLLLIIAAVVIGTVEVGVREGESNGGA